MSSNERWWQESERRVATTLRASCGDRSCSSTRASLSPALSRVRRTRHACRTLPPHERDHHTRGGGEPGGHASETRAAEGEEDDDDDDEERRGGSGDGGRGRLRWLYVAPNLSRGNYCVRNCRSKRNPYAARRTPPNRIVILFSDIAIIIFDLSSFLQIILRIAGATSVSVCES